jgi:hypothetical protein
MCALPDHVEISKRAIRERAVAFSKSHKDDRSEAGERQLFWNDFFLSIFGVSIKSVGQFEMAATRLSTGNRGWIDLLVPGEMAVEHKTLGEDLSKAMDQLFDYLDSLQDAAKPWLLVACDFQNFYWHNLRDRTQGRFQLADLSNNVDVFWWLAGHRSEGIFEDEEAANLVATGYMATLHDAVLASGYDTHSLREWLTRILFCLFADDTEVWDRKAFGLYLFLHTNADGSDLGPTLAYLFQILNTPEQDRAKNLDEDLATFTYINGDLFANNLPIPTCDEATRTALLEACKFDWSAISPAIFGSMFQNVMTPAERRQLGAHYTTEENIMRTIRPLFLDELDSELEQIKVTTSAQSKAALNNFQKKLSDLTFMDPACGCGNFLVIAYRELRRLETEVLRKLAVANKWGIGQVLDVSQLLKVNVAQFYGIEIEEFPARIARTALYLMDHKVNLEVSKEFGQYFARFPIPSSPHITIANALRIDWNEVLQVERANYIFGNPPFVGQSNRSLEQTEDLEIVWGKAYNGYLDYVTGWYIKAVDYAVLRSTSIAFVSTSSICQGEPVVALWNPLLKAGYEISFAYQPFMWKSEAQGKAAVHVVIVGISTKPSSSHQLFSDDEKGGFNVSSVANINPYLTAGPNVLIAPRSKPLTLNLPRIRRGSMVSDGGNLLVSKEDYASVAADPIASKYLRKFIGARELLHGEDRWCLWMPDLDPRDVRLSPILRDRIEAVRKMRLAGANDEIRGMANRPAEFLRNKQPSTNYLAIPRHVSENRKYFPVGYFDNTVISGDHNFVAEDPDGVLFALLSSSMFVTWMKAVGGRLRGDLRFSNTLVWNTFPFPAIDDAVRSRLGRATETILLARSEFPDASLADLYDSNSMPTVLFRAHEGLDLTVDLAFGAKGRIPSSSERLSVLLKNYEKLDSAYT